MLEEPADEFDDVERPESVRAMPRVGVVVDEDLVRSLHGMVRSFGVFATGPD